MNYLGKAWTLGVLLILAFAIVGELLVAFDDYVFHRLGVDRNLTLSILWVLPLVAAYVATRYSRQHKLLAGLSYLVILTFVGAAAHFASGLLGATVDFKGLSGARMVFGIDLAIGSLLIVTGTFVGVLLSRHPDSPRTGWNP